MRVCASRQTELVDVRRGKRNTSRQTIRNRRKESVEIKEQGEGKKDRQGKEGNTEDISDRELVMKGKKEVRDEWGHKEAGSDKEGKKEN